MFDVASVYFSRCESQLDLICVSPAHTGHYTELGVPRPMSHSRLDRRFARMPACELDKWLNLDGQAVIAQAGL